MTAITFSIDAHPTGSYAVATGCKHLLIADPFAERTFDDFGAACDALSVHVAECGVCAHPRTPSGFVKPVYDIGPEFDVVVAGPAAAEVLGHLGVAGVRFNDAWSLDAALLRALLAYARTNAKAQGACWDDLEDLAAAAAERGRLVTCA